MTTIQNLEVAVTFEDSPIGLKTLLAHIFSKNYGCVQKIASGKTILRLELDAMEQCRVLEVLANLPFSSTYSTASKRIGHLRFSGFLKLTTIDSPFKRNDQHSSGDYNEFHPNRPASSSSLLTLAHETLTLSLSEDSTRQSIISLSPIIDSLRSMHPVVAPVKTIVVSYEGFLPDPKGNPIKQTFQLERFGMQRATEHEIVLLILASDTMRIKETYDPKYIYAFQDSSGRIGQELIDGADYLLYRSRRASQVS